MPRFSRGIWPQAHRDVRRIVDATPEADRRLVVRAVRRLLDEVAVDPHTKGRPCPQPGNPLVRALRDGSIQILFWVRQPPLEELFVEVIGFSSG
jgi:hypothetical protein